MSDTAENDARKPTRIGRLRRPYNALMIRRSDRRCGQSVRPAPTSDYSDDWTDLGFWDGR